MSLQELSVLFVTKVWGLPLVFFLSGAGLLFTIYFRFPQIRFFRHAIDVVRGKHDDPNEKGQISHFQALCAALSATIGLGNIAGVAIAIKAGGPGAVFWMWIVGFIGMATKMSSISLAMFYRQEDQGEIYGGPMYTIKNGLKKGLYFLAPVYAVLVILSAVGAGNMFQSNQMSAVLQNHFQIPPLTSGIIFTVLIALVLLGGIKRIAQVASKIVPFMVVIYLIGGLGILIYNASGLGALFKMIVNDAFTGTAAVGGFVGVTFKQVLIQGARRAAFSNEAGFGTASIAHAAAQSKPMKEGLVGMLGPFIDTIVVCTITALVLLSTGTWKSTSGAQGAELTMEAFGSVYGEIGSYIVILAVVLFAFSTIISWSYYGEAGTQFLFGKKAISIYRIIFIIFIAVGSLNKLDTVINFSDAFLGLLVIPNMLANSLLAPKIKKELKDYQVN